MICAATLLSTRGPAFPFERSNKLTLSISTQTMPDDFEKFVEEHYQPAFRFAISLSRNHDDACDLTQQAFFIAQTNRHQLRNRSKGSNGSLRFFIGNFYPLSAINLLFNPTLMN